MRFTNKLFTAIRLKWTPQQQRWSSMDFQLARNLSALSRAQNEIVEALLHIDCLLECLNREIIMSAASSEATEQLVASARATLVQVQNMLAAQSDEGARRLREAQVAFIATRRVRSSSTSASHVSDSDSQELAHQASGIQSCATERFTPSEGHSFAETAIRGRLWRDDASREE